MLKYFFTGIELVLGIGVLRYSVLTLIIMHIWLIWRRLSAARKSGGSFWAPFHISNGIFYIHNALCFSRRTVPMNG